MLLSYLRKGIQVLSLIQVNGPNKGRVFHLETGFPELIGRAANKIKLRDSRISRKHAQVHIQQGQWIIEDLGSSNGTYVNDKKVTGPAPLKEGDRIRIGRVVLVVGMASVEETSADGADDSAITGSDALSAGAAIAAASTAEPDVAEDPGEAGFADALADAADDSEEEDLLDERLLANIAAEMDADDASADDSAWDVLATEDEAEKHTPEVDAADAVDASAMDELPGEDLLEVEQVEQHAQPAPEDAPAQQYAIADDDELPIADEAGDTGLAASGLIELDTQEDELASDAAAELEVVADAEADDDAEAAIELAAGPADVAELGEELNAGIDAEPGADEADDVVAAADAVVDELADAEQEPAREPYELAAAEALAASDDELSLDAILPAGELGDADEDAFERAADEDNADEALAELQTDEPAEVEPPGDELTSVDAAEQDSEHITQAAGIDDLVNETADLEPTPQPAFEAASTEDADLADDADDAGEEVADIAAVQADDLADDEADDSWLAAAIDTDEQQEADDELQPAAMFRAGDAEVDSEEDVALSQDDDHDSQALDDSLLTPEASEQELAEADSDSDSQDDPFEKLLASLDELAASPESDGAADADLQDEQAVAEPVTASPDESGHDEDDAILSENAPPPSELEDDWVVELAGEDGQDDAAEQDSAAAAAGDDLAAASQATPTEDASSQDANASAESPDAGPLKPPTTPGQRNARITGALIILIASTLGLGLWWYLGGSSPSGASINSQRLAQSQQASDVNLQANAPQQPRVLAAAVDQQPPEPERQNVPVASEVYDERAMGQSPPSSAFTAAPTLLGRKALRHRVGARQVTAEPVVSRDTTTPAANSTSIRIPTPMLAAQLARAPQQSSDAPSLAQPTPPASAPELEPSVAPDVPAVAQLPRKGIAFLIDTSGSLVDSLPQVIKSVGEQIMELDPQQQFTVILYRHGRTVEVPPVGMKRATTANKRDVLDWLSPEAGNVIAAGRSDLPSGLELALSYSAAEICVFTDDTLSKSVSNEDLEALFARIRQLLGEQPPKVHIVQFFYRDDSHKLRMLAQELGGTYQFVAAQQAEPAMHDINALLQGSQ